MPWKQNPDTGESYWVDDPMPGAGTEGGATVPDAISDPGALVTRPAQSPEEKQTYLDAQRSKLSALGPGYVMKADGTISISADDSTQLENALWVNQQNRAVPDRDIAGTTQSALDDAQRQLNDLDPRTAPGSPVAAFKASLPTQPGQRRAVTGSGPVGGALAASVDTAGLPANVFGGQGPAAPATPAAPEIGRERINELLGGVNTYANDIYALSKDNTGLSAAEAQLQKATELANIQAGIQTEASQRAAMGQARSARNRGDRAFLEQQAIGEAGFIGQEAARTKALTDATARGDLADLRATEENADRDFKLKALEKASELGLNTAALEFDVSKANLDSTTNMINQQFSQMGIDKQLTQQQAGMMLNFTRDMAAIQFQYDQLSTQDQQEAARMLMQKYDIDQDTMVALEKIKTDNDFDWNALLTTVVGGAASGATAAIAKSDERAKTNIEAVNATAAELDELMGALGAYTYEYKEPEKDGAGLRFGFMAQELEGTRLGKHMVKPDGEGFKTVEIAPLALATASGLALVSERLKALEGAVK